MLVNSVGCLVKTARNATVKRQPQQKKAIVLQSYYGTESGTIFCLLVYHVEVHQMGDQAV